VSPRFRREPFAADHERAKTLAASRLDAPIDPADAGWLADHLAWCRPCRAVAAEYDEQRVALRALRHDQPVAPRDLWARTAAAIEADPEYRRRASRRSRRARSPRASLAPIAGLIVVALVVGVGLLNGSSLVPPLGGTDQQGAEPTPIALTTAGDVQVLGPGNDGTVELTSRQLDQVCPVTVEKCRLSPTLDVTTPIANLSSGQEYDAVLAPDQGQIIVVTRGNGAQAVYVLPVKRHVNNPAEQEPGTSPDVAVAGGSPSPVAVATAKPRGSNQPETTPPATATPETSASASTGPTDEPSASPATQASAEPAGSAAPTDEPTATPSSTPSDAAASPSDEGTPPPTKSPKPTPKQTNEAPAESPTPTVEVTPGPDGAIEIARDVSVVGSVGSYSPDGSRFAFTARPADDSSGPDVYVWRVGDRQAKAVTSDHGSLFSGWLGDRALVSRVVDGSPRTVVLDLSTGSERPARSDSMWRPTVGPGRQMAAWWDGTVRSSDGGETWVPDAGQLVLGAWPDDNGGVQVLADGPLTDWDVRWDPDGRMLAVWVAGDNPRRPGHLSLYAIDPDTGRADLDSPKLDGAPAFAGFSLKSGRLAWSAPKGGNDTSVEVLAWDDDGTVVGQVSMPAQNGSTIVR
jgi:WD40-like Beta Propeller Repeat